MLLATLLACQKTEGTLGLSWDITPGVAVTGKFIDIELDAPGTAVLTCTSKDDSRDIHVVRLDTSRELHSTGVHGLLSSSTYDCVIDAEAEGGLWARGEFRTSTGRLPVGLEEGSVYGDPEAMTGVWTLTNPFDDGKATNDQRMVILDPEGEVRWYYGLDDELGSVDCSIEDGRIVWGGGYEGDSAPRIMTVGGVVLYKGEEPTTGGVYHHDVGLTESGYMAGLITKQGDSYIAFGVEVRDPENDGELLYMWESDVAVAKGELPEGRGDLYHANALEIEEVDGDPRYAWVNVRNLNRYIRIDLVEQTIDRKLLAGSGLNDDDAWNLSHDTKRVGETLLMYDNGYRKPGESSRVVEYEADLEAGTYELVWEWTEDNWREPAWGGADWLENGNVLVAIGHCEGSSCDEAHPDGRSAVIEVDRETDEIVWAYRWEDEKVGLYRAERADGCDLFSNAQFCPQLLDP